MKRSLEIQRKEFSNRKFLATPISGLIFWFIIGIAGLFHALTRTAVVLALWYWLPDARFVAIPFAIVAIYLATILILNNRKLE